MDSLTFWELAFFGNKQVEVDVQSGYLLYF